MASYFFVTEKRFAKEMPKNIPLPAGRQDGRSVALNKEKTKRKQRENKETKRFFCGR